MKIVLASANQGKINEFKTLLPNATIQAYKEFLGDFEIPETGSSFQENAIIKAQAIANKLNDENIIVISDDSGLSVPALNNEPGIYSARYAGINANDAQNNAKLIEELNKKGLSKTQAFYTACIAIVYQNRTYTVHGWLYGNVVNYQKGTNGFGYDPMFIPDGFDQTVGELSSEIKKSFSHRNKALQLALKVLKVIS